MPENVWLTVCALHTESDKFTDILLLYFKNNVVMLFTLFLCAL